MKRAIPILLLSALFMACEPPAPGFHLPEITRETKPWSRWWWQGSAVTREGITAELEAYQKAGFGGLEITPIYGVRGEEDQFVEYLSPQWVDLLEFTLSEAKRLGLGIDMATGTGWPFGGPWVGENDACKYLAYKTWKLKEGEKLNQPIEYQEEGYVRAVTNHVNQPIRAEDLVQPVAANKNLQALALDQVRFPHSMPLQSLVAYSDRGESVDLMTHVTPEGKLNWQAPAGSWTIYGIFQGQHGKMVERAAPGGEGNVIDHFSKEAIQHYLARFDSVFAERDISTLRSFFNDSYEVDDALGQANWTPGLLEAFQEKHGYDLRAHWPALFGEDTEENHQRVLSDFRETISDLLLETFTTEWSQWAEKRGAITRNQAHGSPANILDLYAASAIPETEGTDIIRIKLGTSAAHVTGKKLASSESATWLNEHFFSSLADLKQNTDRFFAGGVNHIFYHGSCYSPPGDPWPGRLFYAAFHANSRNPLWHDFPAFNQYIARTQSFLQSGKPDNDILLYFPAYDRFAAPQKELLDHFDGRGPGFIGSEVEVLARKLQQEGYSFDFISDRQIQNISISNGKPETGGVSYQTIVLPACKYLPLNTLSHILMLAENGAQVVIHQALPESVPGLGNLQENQARFLQLLETLSFEETTVGIKQASLGKGSVFIGGDMEKMLAYAGTEPEAMAGKDLNYTRRSYENGYYYFVANWSGKEMEGWIPLQKDAQSVMIYDPVTGEKGIAKQQPGEDGKPEIYLQLSHGQSLILITSDRIPEETPWHYLTKTGKTSALEGEWEIRFIEGGPVLPPPVKTKNLVSWTELGEDYQHFSGTAVYQLVFSRPEGDGWILDLGGVHESAVVKLNHTPIGTLFGPTYQIFIDPKLIKEHNTLEIEVSGLMLNRIIDMDQKGVPWKKFYNVNFPARRAEHRDENGLFDASRISPVPSGLLGPVTLSPAR
ncbi:MAG: glycosyl hydrolase [Bacteroidia bacterium]